MKNKIILLSILSGSMFAACKKDKSDSNGYIANTPKLEIRFGYTKPGYGSITAYANQNYIPPDSILLYDNFGISIDEYYLPNNFYVDIDSLVFAFDVRTKYDSEHFDNNKNIYLGLHWVANGLGFGGEFLFPYKFSPVAVPGNDTLELNINGDFTVVNYVSHHSSLFGKDSLAIHK